MYKTFDRIVWEKIIKINRLFFSISLSGITYYLLPNTHCLLPEGGALVTGVPGASGGPTVPQMLAGLEESISPSLKVTDIL